MSDDRPCDCRDIYTSSVRVTCFPARPESAAPEPEPFTRELVLEAVRSLRENRRRPPLLCGSCSATGRTLCHGRVCPDCLGDGTLPDEA
ncbi:hypothetical protein ACFY0N_00210 [Streptomyces vinaceus]|uniref:hypothetical protein n=1 Tax=Streptomyces vinaceus TaxID=1960 RepID=UPI0036A79D7A